MNTRFKRRKTPTTYEELLQIDAWSRDALCGPPRPPPKPKKPNTRHALKGGQSQKRGQSPRQSSRNGGVAASQAKSRSMIQ